MNIMLRCPRAASKILRPDHARAAYFSRFSASMTRPDASSATRLGAASSVMRLRAASAPKQIVAASAHHPSTARHAALVAACRAPQFASVRSLSSKVSGGEVRMMGMVVRGCLHGLKHLFRMYSNGEIEGRTFFMILALPTGIIIYFCVEYGPEVVLGAAMDSEVVVVKEELSEEEKAQQLEALEEERRDLQRVGEVKLLAGTAPPPTWTSDQARPNPARVRGGAHRGRWADPRGARCVPPRQRHRPRRA